MKKLIANLIITTAIGAFLTGCGTQRGTSTGTMPQGGSQPAVSQPASDLTDAGIFGILAADTHSWKNVALSAKINLTAPTQTGVSAKITMVRDKSIDVSVRMLGFEVAYLVADTDSVHGYVKINKKYVSESLARIFGSDHYTLANVQDLVMGRLFYPGRSDIAASQATLFDFNDIDGMVIATPRSQQKEAEFGFVISRDGTLVSTAVTAGSHEGIATYWDIASTPAGKIAGQTGLAVDNGRMAATIDWDLHGARWNASGVKAREWSTPRGATRIKISSSLLKSLLGGL